MPITREPDQGDKNTVQLIADDGSKISTGDKVTIYGRIFVLNDQQNVCRVKDVSKIEKYPANKLVKKYPALTGIKLEKQ